MRLAQLAPLLIIVVSTSGCHSAPAIAPPSTMLTEPVPVPTIVQPVPLDSVLWDTNTVALQKAFRHFADFPGTTPNRRFATLTSSSGPIRFAVTPRGWKTWQEDAAGVQEITLDASEMFTYIGIAPCDDKPFNTERELQCFKGKEGNTNYVEVRRIQTRQGWVAVKLTVVAHCGTLGELLEHLQKHYGNYEGVCQEVQRVGEKPEVRVKPYSVVGIHGSAPSLPPPPLPETQRARSGPCFGPG